MLIENGAELPNVCLVTGRKTHQSMNVSQTWKPAWVHWCWLFGIFPYFLVAPFFNRRWTLDVPVAPSIFRRYLTVVKSGIVILVVGVTTVIAGSMTSDFPGASLLVAIGSLVVVIGLFVVLHRPLKLRVVDLTNGVLTLTNVHPNCLAVLPEVHRRNSEFVGSN